MEIPTLQSQNVASQFRKSLLLPSEKRRAEDIQLIYSHLSEIQGISQLNETTIRTMAQTARYEVHESSEIMYTAGDTASCWYILLSGSVYLDGCMYLPGSSFGKPTKTGQRNADCLILEKSEMIVIDYPAGGSLHQAYCRRSYAHNDLEQLFILDSNIAPDRKINVTKEEPLPVELQHVKEILQRSENYLDKIGRDDHVDHRKARNKSSSSYSSNTSNKRGSEDFELDLSGLKETMGEFS